MSINKRSITYRKSWKKVFFYNNFKNISRIYLYGGINSDSVI